MKLESNIYGTRTDGRPPVLVLHGLLGSADNWHTVCRRLENRFELHAIDLRNHGRSPHDPEMSYPVMAADVIEYADSIDAPTVDVLGHSMGGKTGMEAALGYPKRIRRLVVEDMVPFATNESNRRFVEALRDLPAASLSARKEAERFLSERITSRSMVLFLLKNLTREDDGSYRIVPDIASILANYDRLWEGLAGNRTFDGRVLFIRGGRSGYLRDSDVPPIRTLFPEAELESVPDAGHWVHAEQIDRFCVIVSGFLLAE